MQTELRNKNGFSQQDYIVIIGLLLLSGVPILAGMVRVYQLAQGVVTDETVRFHVNPIPVVFHIFSATIFSCLGAFQFAPGFRRQYLNLHRRNGKILVVAAFVVAITSLWMTLFYPFASLDGDTIYFVRILVGIAMLMYVFFGINAIHQKKYEEHGHWMIRAYALAMGAGTQVFTHIPWIFLPEIKNEFTRAVFMILGWAINITVAECIIQKQKHSKREIL